MAVEIPTGEARYYSMFATYIQPQESQTKCLTGFTSTSNTFYERNYDFILSWQMKRAYPPNIDAE